MDELREKLEKYLLKAAPAFDSIEVTGPGGDKVRDTAIRYFSDARHFLKRGEHVNAFAALEYAEGWLDAGVVLKVVKAKTKDTENY